ncbi:hypothetical protein [Actinokineospora sp.]|uniref:hypothetical protein n=1 Tax=Actinokineospora sp. TaxID=1872133 RepID=UPI0040382497
MKQVTCQVLSGVLLLGVLAGCGSAVSGTPDAGPSSASSTTTVLKIPASPSSTATSSSSAPGAGTPENPTVTVRKKVDGVDLCGLLTKEDIQTITGQPTRLSRFDETRCNYTFGAGGTGGTSVTVLQSNKIVLGTAKNTAFDLAGNTGIRREPRPAECAVMVFTAPWNRSSEPYGQGLVLELTGFAPATVDRCALGLEMLKVMFDRLPAGG